MARLLVIIVGVIQGWLASQGWEDLEKRKETHPKVVYIHWSDQEYTIVLFLEQSLFLPLDLYLMTFFKHQKYHIPIKFWNRMCFKMIILCLIKSYSFRIC